MAQKKFEDIEILTTRVYLNIYEGNIVYTKMMPTGDAQIEYGDKDATFVGEPEYDKNPIGKEDDKGKKSGVTNVVLK